MASTQYPVEDICWLWKRDTRTHQFSKKASGFIISMHACKFLPFFVGEVDYNAKGKQKENNQGTFYLYVKGVPFWARFQIQVSVVYLISKIQNKCSLPSSSQHSQHKHRPSPALHTFHCCLYNHTHHTSWRTKHDKIKATLPDIY